MAWNCSALFHKCLRRGGTGRDREGGEGRGSGGCVGVRGGPLRRRCHQTCASITTCSLQRTFNNQTSHHLCCAATRPIIAPSVRLPCIALFIVQRSVFQQHVVCGGDLPPLEQTVQQMQPCFYSYWYYFHRQHPQDQFNPMSPLFQIPYFVLPSFCAYCWLLKSSHFAATASPSPWK